MAIKDIQQQLIKSEGQSGEFLIKKIKADLDEVYKRGYGDETSPLLDSYWDQALKEFSDEASRAVKKGKSKEAKEVLKDLEVFQKSLEATEEISGSGIAAGTLAMLQAVKPHIEKRAKTLSKNESIFKSMKKKAVGSATGAVESFASGFLAPLPFGAGEAIIEKTKGFLGAGKGDKAERQAEQAVSFAGRIEREGEPGGGNGAAGNGGGEVVGIGSNGVAEDGGVVAGGGKGGGGNLGETNEILRDILKALKPDKETAREEEREDDRQHKALLDAMKKKGRVSAAGLDGEDGGGFLSSLLGTALGTGGIPGVGGFFGGKGGRGNAPGSKATQFKKGWNKTPTKGLNPANLFKGPAFKTALSVMTVPLMGALTPILGFLMSPPGLIALAAAATVGGLWWAGSKILEEKSSEEISETLEKVKSTPAIHAGRVTKKQAEKMKVARVKSLKEDLIEAEQRESGEGKKGKWVWEGLGRQRKRVWKGEDLVKTIPRGQEEGVAHHAEGVTDVEQTHYAKIHKGETVLDNIASKDFKTGLETLEYLQANLGAELMELQKGMHAGQSVKELKAQGYIGSMYIPSKFDDAFGALQDKESKWAKGITELLDIFTRIGSENTFHRLMGIDSVMEQAESKYDKKFGSAHTKLLYGMSKKEEYLWETMNELGLDWMAGKSGDKGKFQAKENMENFTLSQLLDLKSAVNRYMRIKEDIGAPLAASGRLKKGIEFGNILKPELVKARAAVQKIVGGQMFHDPTGGGWGDKRGASWEIAPGIEDPAKTFGFNPKIQSIEFLKEHYPPMLWPTILPQSDNYPSYMKRRKEGQAWAGEFTNVPSGKYGMGVAKGGLGLLHKGEEVLEKAEVATIAQALAGNQLNNAAFDRVGLNGQGVVINAPTVNAPTSVSNNTITPKRLPSPNFGGRVGEGDKFLS